MMNRRGFFKLAAFTAAAVAIEEAIPNNRVWFFPKEIKLYKQEDVTEIEGRVMHFRYDVTQEQIQAAFKGEIPWETLQTNRPKNRFAQPFEVDNDSMRRYFESEARLIRKDREYAKKIVLTDL